MFIAALVDLAAQKGDTNQVSVEGREDNTEFRRRKKIKHRIIEYLR